MEPDELTIAHCVIELGACGPKLLEAEVAYQYRGNTIMESLTALARKLTGAPIPGIPEDGFKYL